MVWEVKYIDTLGEANDGRKQANILECSTCPGWMAANAFLIEDKILVYPQDVGIERLFWLELLCGSTSLLPHLVQRLLLFE